MIGATASVIELLARFGVDDCDRKPRDCHGIDTTAPEHVGEVAHHRHCREAPIPVVPFTRGHRVVGLPQGSARIELGMGVGFARKNKMETLL
jgi:hypothetical protein